MFLFKNPVIFWAYLAFTWSVGCVEFPLSQLNLIYNSADIKGVSH